MRTPDLVRFVDPAVRCVVVARVGALGQQRLVNGADDRLQPAVPVQPGRGVSLSGVLYTIGRPKLSIRRPVPTVLLLVKRGIVQTTAVSSDTYLSIENRSANAQFWPANCKVHSLASSQFFVAQCFLEAAQVTQALGLPSPPSLLRSKSNRVECCGIARALLGWLA